MKPIYEPIRFEPLPNPHKKKWFIIVNRLNGYDPAPLYERLEIDPKKRRQSYRFDEVWPTEQAGVCACGCGEVLSGRRTRWATDLCSGFAATVYCVVINGDTAGTINNILTTIKSQTTGERLCCIKCGSHDSIQIDHIIGVAHGGGGCWLNNFEPLCHDCHVDKTNRTFSRGKYKTIPMFPAEQPDTEINFGLFKDLEP